MDNQAIEAAAGVYTTVMAGEGDQDISLSKASHAVGKILWQQRFFTQALGACMSKLKEYPTSLPFQTPEVYPPTSPGHYVHCILRKCLAYSDLNAA